MAIKLIYEKDNFDGSVNKAANYYYKKFKYNEITADEIRDNLVKFGYTDDFADSVLSLIADKLYEDELYWNDYDESVSRKRKQSKRLKEDSLDDFQGDSKYDINYIHKDYVPSLKSVARAAASSLDADDSKVIIKWEPMDSEVDGMGTLTVGYPGTSGIGYYIQSNVYNYAVDSGIIGKYYDPETGEPCNLFFKENYKSSAKTKSSRRIKEDSWDDIVNPSIEKRYIWPLDEDSAYEVTDIIKYYITRFRDEIKGYDIKEIEYQDWPALELEIECSYRAYEEIYNDIKREGLYMDDDDECFDEGLKEENEPRQISYRIDHYGSWDNGRVLHSYKKGTLDDAEEEARKASLKDKDNLYYVLRDNIMDPTTDWSWYQGRKYHYSDDKEELDDIKREINKIQI